MPEQATRALLNIRNHTLDGRSLNVEYASAEAVRRGGLGTKRAGGAGAGAPRGGSAGGRGRGGMTRGGGRGGGGERGGRGGAGRSTSGGRDWDDSAMRDYAAQPRDDARDVAPHLGGRGGFAGRGRGRDNGYQGRGDFGGGDRTSESRPTTRPPKDTGVRAKPGAALASAQRASEGIVQSTGRKITFD